MSNQKYSHKSRKIQAVYQNGELHSIININADKIDWDALKHDIPYYEAELDTQSWFKVVVWG